MNFIKALLFLLAGVSFLEAGEVNVYSARHYDSDKSIYKKFEEETGIKVNIIEGKGSILLERILAEGENSPADVLLTVDAGNLWKADQKDLFQPINSEILNERIPENLRHPDNHWFALAKRTRVIFYNKLTVDVDELSTYEDLASPKWEGRIAIRSSNNIYNQSLLASMIANHGQEKAMKWAQGIVDNMARKPQGNDRSQLKAILSGEADIAVANSYYYGRYVDSDKKEDQELVRTVGIFFPNQNDRGTHINISGAGVLKHSKNKEAAQRFIEFMTERESQAIFAKSNYEFPVVKGSPLHPNFAYLSFKEDKLNVSVLGELNPEAVKTFDMVGWR